MQFTVKLKASVALDSTLYFPISRDASNFKILLNEKRFKSFEVFEYGVAKNNGIWMNAKEGDEFVITYDVPIHPSPLNLTPQEYLTNDERYTKWIKNGLVEKFSKENESLNIDEYIAKAIDYVKSRLNYKGFATGQLADRYEFTDENLRDKKDVDCVGFHGTLVALLRAKGIPALLEFGFRLGKGDDPHVWAVYFDKKWERIDILDDIRGIIGDNDDFPRVSVSTGTTHDFTNILGSKSTVSYIQYVLSDTLLKENKRSVFAVFDSFVRKDLSWELVSKIFKAIFSYDDFLYILQLEDYLNDKYFKILKNFFFRRLIQRRDTLKNTTRIQFIKVITIALQLFILNLSFFAIYSVTFDILFSAVTTILLILPILFAIPLFVPLANSFAFPLYSYFRNVAISKAKSKVAKMTNLKIVMISGSYGKTSVKNFVYEMLSPVYRTQMTAGNINTHAGIAFWVNNSLNEGTQVLVCEVDGFHEGEVRDIAKMIPSDIAVITYLGDQHLERLESKKTLAKTLLENVVFSKSNSTVITSGETLKDLKENGVSLDQSLEGRELKVFDFDTKIADINPDLSDSNIKNVKFALEVAKNFEIPNDILEDTIKNIKLPDRRQKVITKNGFTVIDDSYNISLNTANEGLNRAIQLGKKESKKLIVIFAGIGELGRENADANYEYAKRLTENAELVILLNSIYKKQILKAFEEEKYTKFKVVHTMADAISLYERLYNPNVFVVLMHPELTDLYY